VTVQLDFIFRDRDNTSNILIPSLDYRVKNYSWDVIGGPKKAKIVVTGSKTGLYDLLEHLRAPVEIHDSRGVNRWWGIINSVKVSWDNITFGAMLDDMYNSIAVAYTEDGKRKTTAWSADSESTAEYGTKQLLMSLAEVSAAKALQKRDTQLQLSKYPVISTEFSRGGENQAVIDCIGWLDTLDWVYYSNNSGKESYEALGRNAREIGEDDRPILAQSIQIAASAAWDASEIWVRPWKYPSGAPPVDNFVVGLYSDNGDAPNALLASGSVAGANIGASSDWIKFTLNVAVTLNTATKYWIRCSRSGATSASAYFMVDINGAGGYVNGKIKLYNTNTSAWVDEYKNGLNGDLNFIVWGNLSTTAQISSLITNVGIFFTGTDIENASGVNTNPYRDGDTTAYYELMKLLDTGTTNNRRLLCEVTPWRGLRVYEEPAKPTDIENSYAIDATGRIIRKYDREMPQEECPVGMWCHLKDVIPASLDLSKLTDPSLFFVEEASFDVETGRYEMLRVRDQNRPFEVGGVKEG